MKRITLAMMLVAAAAAVGAQTPPVPPTQPARPVPAPAPVARPARPAIVPVSPIDIDEMRFRLEDMRLDRLDLEPARRAMEEVRAQQFEIADAAREAGRLAREDARRAREDALEQSRIGLGVMRDLAPLAPLAAMPALVPLAQMPALAPTAPAAYARLSDGLRIPSPQWFQGDPADSAYRFAQDMLNRGDYGRAAQLFRDIAQKYPKSSYQNDLPYWEAYARYKIGTTDELKRLVESEIERWGKIVHIAGVAGYV